MNNSIKSNNNNEISKFDEKTNNNDFNNSNFIDNNINGSKVKIKNKIELKEMSIKRDSLNENKEKEESLNGLTMLIDENSSNINVNANIRNP